MPDPDDMHSADFMADLIFDAPSAPMDMPVPPVLAPNDEVMVHREIDLPVDVDDRLRAAAAARGMSVQEFVRNWAEHAA
jgi:hypothetical protein